MNFLTQDSLLFEYLKKPFPEYPDPVQYIADYLECEFTVVSKLAEKYPDPTEQSPETFELYKAWMHRNLKVGNAASALAEEIAKADPHDVGNFERSLGVTIKGLREFSQACYDERDGLLYEVNRMPRAGGKRRDALIVVAIVHDVFVSLQRPTSAQHVSGEPVSSFGQAVKYALKVWKVDSDWRRPSEAAIKGERIYSIRYPPE